MVQIWSGFCWESIGFSELRTSTIILRWLFDVYEGFCGGASVSINAREISTQDSKDVMKIGFKGVGHYICDAAFPSHHFMGFPEYSRNTLKWFPMIFGSAE